MPATLTPLNSWEAGGLEVYVDNNCPELQQAPKFLGVHLDWTLSYKQHLQEMIVKTSPVVSPIHHLAVCLDSRL